MSNLHHPELLHDAMLMTEEAHRDHALFQTTPTPGKRGDDSSVSSLSLQEAAPSMTGAPSPAPRHDDDDEGRDVASPEGKAARRSLSLAEEAAAGDLPVLGTTSSERSTHHLAREGGATTPVLTPPKAPVATSKEPPEGVSLPERRGSVTTRPAAAPPPPPPAFVTSSSEAHFFYLGRAAECVVLKPEFFQRVGLNFLQPDLIWNAATRKELCARLLQETAALDVDLTALCSQQHLRRLREKERASMVSGGGAADDDDDDDDDVAEKGKDASSSSSSSSSVSFEESQMKWNDSDFVVHYRCLASEVKVGRYYLQQLLHNTTQQQEGLGDDKGSSSSGNSTGSTGAGGGSSSPKVRSVQDIEVSYADDFLQLLHLRMSLDSNMDTVRLCLITVRRVGWRVRGEG